ncbi:MAG: hypothetical protein KF773_16835 [Deltaproteobacteria bacterium]|nr:hypothetical protein [Deltaproteobacteria bacterium]
MEYWALIIAAIGAIATALALALNWRLLRETALLREGRPSLRSHSISNEVVTSTS